MQVPLRLDNQWAERLKKMAVKNHDLNLEFLNLKISTS